MKKSTVIDWSIIIIIVVAIFIFFVVTRKTASPVTTTNPPVGTTVEDTTPCTLTATGTITAYSRPALGASNFGTINSGDTTIITAKTPDGWLAFDPGTAQAANVGPFRFRYIAPGYAGALSGNCGGIPSTPSLPATACFFMPQDDSPVYTSANSASASLGIMYYGDYAPVVSKVTTPKYFFEVDPSTYSNVPNIGKGWVDGTHGNFSGNCSAYYGQ